MKEQMAIRELVKEVRRQHDPSVKRDFLPLTRDVEMVLRAGREVENGWGMESIDTEHDTPMLVWPGAPDAMPLTPWAHEQLAKHIGIPTRYYNALMDTHPDLLVRDVNTLLGDQPKDEVRMVRTLNGNVRAFVSNTYEPLDNADFLDAMLPLLNPNVTGMPVEWRSAGLTDTHLRVKFTIATFERVLRVGTVLRMGGIFSNSEVGAAKQAFSLFYEILACTNGAITTSFMPGRYNRRHSGNRKDAYSDPMRPTIRTIIERQERQAKALTELGDAVRMSLQMSTLERLTAPMVAAMHPEWTVASPAGAVELLGSRTGLTLEEQAGVLDHFMHQVDDKASPDRTIWGLSSAVTRYSQDVPTYDRATELERIGGQIIELPKSDWRVICEAKPKPRKGNGNGDEVEGERSPMALALAAV